METEHLLVAVPELRRMAPDALRMVGIPIGQADETADMFVWTEAVTGRALRFLRLNRNRMLWSPRSRLVVVREEPNEVVLDARGGSLLEYGIRVVDFACAEASRGSSTSVLLENTYGSPVPAIPGVALGCPWLPGARKPRLWGRAGRRGTAHECAVRGECVDRECAAPP